jgi:hypothetical protein
MERHHPTSSLKKGLRLSLQHGKSLPLFFRDAEGIIWVDICHMVTPLTRIRTFKLLEPRRSISGEFDLIKMFLKSSFNTTMHNHTQALKTHEAITKLGLFSPTHHTAQILLPQISTSSELSKTPSMGKRSESDDEVTEVAACTKFNLVQERDSCSCFSRVQSC